MSTVRTVLTDATIVTMDKGRTVFRDGYIAIDHGEIVAVGSGEPQGFVNSIRYSLGGATVMPGLVNTHQHLSASLLRGIGTDHQFTIEWKRTAEESQIALLIDEAETYASTLFSCAELIRSGVTTTADSLAAWAGKRKSEGALAAAHDSGLRVAHTVAFTDKSPMIPAVHQFSPKAARAEFERLRDLFEYGLVTVGSEALSLPRASDELILALRRPGEGMHSMHLSYSQEFADSSRREHGHSAIEHLDKLGVLDDQLLGAHPIHMDDNEIRLFSRAGSSASYCAVSNMVIGTGTLPLHKLRASGIAVGLGLDGHNDSLNMFETMKMSVLAQRAHALDATLGDAGLAIELATIEGARALGMDGRIGSLEKGKSADLIVIDSSRPHLNPSSGLLKSIVFSGSPDAVTDVMVDGKWLMSHGRIERFDERGAVRAVNEAHTRILRAAGYPPGYLDVPRGWELI